MDIGESKQKNALLWDQINSVDYSTFNVNQILPQLETRHNLRLANDVEYKEFLNDLSEFEEKSNIKTISLNYDVRKKELDESKKDADTEDEPEEDNEDNPHDKDKKKKDILLDESTKVLGDYLLLSGN